MEFGTPDQGAGKGILVDLPLVTREPPGVVRGAEIGNSPLPIPVDPPIPNWDGKGMLASEPPSFLTEDLFLLHHPLSNFKNYEQTILSLCSNTLTRMVPLDR